MKIKYTRSSLLFLIAYVMWITVTLLRYTYIKDLFPAKLPMGDVLMYTRWLVYILLSLKFWNDGIYKFRNFLGLAIVFFIGYIEYSVRDKSVLIFMLCLFIYSASNVEFDDILKATLIVDLIVLVLTIGFSFSGVIPNNVWDEGVRHRYDLGFRYCTFGSHLMLFITMVYSCIRKKVTFIEVIVLMLANFWLYSYNNTRIDLCIVIPFLVAFYVWTHYFGEVRKNFITKFMFQYSGVVIAVISIAVQIFYNPDIHFLARIDGLLSNRLDLGHRAVGKYGFTLFGQYIRWVGQGSVKKNSLLAYNYVDSSFLKYTLNYGVVFLILLLIGLVYIGKKAIERDEKALCVSLLFLYVFAMVDAELCVLAFHPFLLKIGELLNPVYEKKTKKPMERIIHLDDMLVYIVKQWKVFVIGAILVGSVFVGIGIFKVNKKYDLEKEKNYNIEIEQHNNIENLQARIDDVYLSLSKNAKEAALTQKMYEAGIYALKRVVLFICISVLFFILKYMFSFRLIYVYDLWDMYGIKVIDVLSSWNDESLSIVAEKIMGNIDGSGNSLLLLSSEKEQMDWGDAGALIQMLERNVVVNTAAGIEDIITIKLIKECDNIILVESIGKSRYSRIEDTIENIRVLNKSVNSAVIVKN